MNREILFRGKRVSDNEWMYGSLILDKKFRDVSKEIPYIRERGLNEATSYYYGGAGLEVIPETIGKYSGLTDKNGTKIFEGDIHHHYDTHSKKDRWYIVCYGEFHDTVYNFDGYGWYFAEINGDDTESFEGNEQDYVNIVGNIYDNHELLGG